MITSATNSTTESRELKLLLFHIKSYPYFNQMSCRWNSHDWKTYIWLRTYRSLIFCPAWLQERYVVIYLIPYRKKKRGASSCRSFHGVRPSHCPSSRNEQRGLAPRKVYIQWCSLMIGYNCGCTSSTKRIFAYTLQGAFPVALFLTWWLEFAKFYTVKTKASRKRLFKYVLSCPPASGRMKQPFICSNSFAPW